MFTQIKVWKVTCDKCKKVYDGDNIWYAETKKEAIESIENDDWWHYRNGKVYCEDCFVY